MDDESFEETNETLLRQESESGRKLGRATAGDGSRIEVQVTQYLEINAVSWSAGSAMLVVVSIRFVYRQYSRLFLEASGIAGLIANRET